MCAGVQGRVIRLIIWSMEIIKQSFKHIGVHLRLETLYNILAPNEPETQNILGIFFKKKEKKNSIQLLTLLQNPVDSMPGHTFHTMVLATH